MRRNGFIGRVVAAIALLSAVSLAATACGSSSDNAASSSGSSGNWLPASLKGSAPGQVKIGLAGGYALAFMPVVLAEGLGYYKDVADRFGTKISFNVYGGGTAAEPAFLGGADQFVIIGTNSWLGAVAQGKDQVGVFSASEGLSITIAAAQKYQAQNGTDLSKFQGVTWCQTGPVGTAHTALVLAAALHGIRNPDIVSVGSVSAYTPALQAGRCGVAAEDVTSAAAQIHDKIAYTVENANDPDASRSLAGQQLAPPLTTSRAFANEHPELTQAIVDATLKSLLYIQQNLDNPDAIYNKLPAEAKKSYDNQAAFGEAWALIKNSFAPKYDAGGVTQQQANDTAAFLLATGSAPAGYQVNPDQVWWNKWVHQAYTDLATQIPAESQFPAALSTTVGPPSPEAAKAVSIVRGG